MRLLHLPEYPLVLKYTMSVLFLFMLAFPAVSQVRSTVDFSAENIDGETVYFKDYVKAGIVYIDFWALWCIPCKAELKVLQPIYNKYRDSGLTVLAINIDNMKSASKVKSYVVSQRFTTPVLLDPNSQVLGKFNGNYIPYSLLMDAEGNIIKTRTGYLPGDENEIESDIVGLLRKLKHD